MAESESKKAPGKPDRIVVALGGNALGESSMEPKVKAAITFAESRPGRVAIIGSLEKAAAAANGESGTRIHL